MKNFENLYLLSVTAKSSLSTVKAIKTTKTIENFIAYHPNFLVNFVNFLVSLFECTDFLTNTKFNNNGEKF